MPLLTASNLAVAYAELEIFSGVALDVAERARIGVVGPNGGGKTSLLRVLIGEQEPNGGSVFRANGVRIGYVPQISGALTDGTLRDEVMLVFKEIASLEGALAASALEVQRAEPGERRGAERRYSALVDRYERLGGYDYHNHMDRVADGVGLTPEVLETPTASASGGERTRAALARALLADPDILMLDEPTNYLDFKGLAWLEEFLGKCNYAFVVVSHDRYFLDRVVNQIWELDHGRLDTYRGNYTAYRAQKAEREVLQLKKYNRQQEFIAKEQYYIDRYRAGQRSRQAKGREKRLTRMERVEAPRREAQTIQVANVATSRTPRIVVKTEGLRVGFVEDGRTTELLTLPDFILERGTRTAVIGSNGVGKTTLLQTMLGTIAPLSGAATIGQNVKAGYHRQGSDDLPEGASVLGAMQEYRNIPPAEERNYLARFLFHGDDVFKPVSALSGGERTRLAVARLMVSGPNLLMLDEPTTHLDIPSREALEQALLEYDGTLLFVSHDRHLISLLAGQLLIAERGGAYLYPGRFEQWSEEGGLPPTPTPPVAERPPAGRRVGTTRRKFKKTPKSRAEPRPDHEQTIAALEARLARIESELQRASERQDVKKIGGLGKQYDQTKAELERAWEEWRE